MIRQCVNIMVRGKPWNITAFYPLTRYHVKEIIDALYSIHCNREDLRKAYKNLTSGQMNNGLTFSNYVLRKTVTVFAKSTCPEQYFNLIAHELHHLSVHIAIANGFDLSGEEVCYINGDIAQSMHPVCKLFIT
ncbi:hypothetical protein HMPREF0103_0040 [Bacteroides sp. 2_1_33B]|nr:hypothetical protein HMPREF0103_0040 [Bacteroides sp. 2_1_33B]HBN42364.1 hypothetical protein [Parabacteroides distasonis]